MITPAPIRIAWRYSRGLQKGQAGVKSNTSLFTVASRFKNKTQITAARCRMQCIFYKRGWPNFVVVVVALVKRYFSQVN